jgi:hypothetical protein
MKDLKGELFLKIRASADAVKNGLQGVLSAYDVVDSYGTVCDKGCFDRSITERGTKYTLFYQHDYFEPIGQFNVTDTKASLAIEGSFNTDVQRGREAAALLARGDIDGLSIGFRPIKSFFDKEGIEHFTDVELMEGSFVSFPANPLAHAYIRSEGKRMRPDVRKRILNIDIVKRLTDDEKSELISKLEEAINQIIEGAPSQDEGTESEDDGEVVDEEDVNRAKEMLEMVRSL